MPNLDPNLTPTSSNNNDNISATRYLGKTPKPSHLQSQSHTQSQPQPQSRPELVLLLSTPAQIAAEGHKLLLGNTPRRNGRVKRGNMNKINNHIVVNREGQMHVQVQGGWACMQPQTRPFGPISTYCNFVAAHFFRFRRSTSSALRPFVHIPSCRILLQRHRTTVSSPRHPATTSALSTQTHYSHSARDRQAISPQISITHLSLSINHNLTLAPPFDRPIPTFQFACTP
ncbi:hypothetical protein BU17DRAFT_98264 [Hysterangium stoloniferum]|nr:hypothetical protein BU17DRAFT_98264 [Hysterangium stoloniferum]